MHTPEGPVLIQIPDAGVFSVLMLNNGMSSR